MATTNDIKAGGAYVELTADNANLLTGLSKAEARIKFFGRAVSAAFVGRAMRKMSEDILDVQKQLAEGTLESGQGTAAFGDAIAKSIPVLGDFYSAAKNIVMALDGTAASAANAQSAMEKMNAEVAGLRKVAEHRKAFEGLRDAVRGYTLDLNDAFALELAQTDADREYVQMRNEHARTMEKIAEMERKANEMVLGDNPVDKQRRADALKEATTARFRAEELYRVRYANWENRQNERGAQEATRLAEENARLTAEHFDFVRSLDQRAHDLRIEAIEDEDARALEKINVRYAREREEILKNGRTQTEQDVELAASERARQQEVANFEAQQARQRAASLQSLDEQLAEARDAADATLTDQDRRLRAIDRQEAAALAGAVVGGAVPLDMADRIRQLADLQRAAVGAAEPVTSSSGAFSGAMLQSLQGANISAAEETAENTAALLKSSNEMVRELRKKGVFFL